MLDGLIAAWLGGQHSQLVLQVGPAGGGASFVHLLETTIARHNSASAPVAVVDLVSEPTCPDHGEEVRAILLYPFDDAAQFAAGRGALCIQIDTAEFTAEYAGLLASIGVGEAVAEHLAQRFSPATALLDDLKSAIAAGDDVDLEQVCLRSATIRRLLESIADPTGRVLELGRVLLLLRPQEAELSDEWPALASAVSMASCSIADVSRALLTFPWLFSVDRTTEGPTVRPRNQLAATLLAGLTPISGSEHFAVFQALRQRAIDSLSRQDSSDDFVARQLPRQAMASFSFEDLFRDALSVLCSDPLALVREIEREPTLALNPGAKAVLLSAHRLLERTNRASSLELNALRIGLTDFAAEIRESLPSRPWRTLWTRAQPVNANRILFSHSAPVLAMDTDLQRLLVGTGDASAWIVEPYGPATCIWAEPDTAGEIRGVGLHAGRSGELLAALVTSDQRVVVVDCEQRSEVWSDILDHAAPLSALAVSDDPDEPLLATAGVDGLIRIVRLRTNEVPTPTTSWYRHQTGGRAVEVRCLRFVDTEHGLLLLWVAVDGSVGVLDPMTSEVLHTRVVSDAVLNGLSVLAHEGRFLLAFAASNGDVLRSELTVDDGITIGDPHLIARHRASANAVHIRRWMGEPVVMAASADRSWSLTTMSSSSDGEFIEGHHGAVEDVCWVEPDGIDLAVTVGGDGCVRAWVPDAVSRESLMLEKPTRHAGPVTAIAMEVVDSRPIIWTGGADGEVRAWAIDSASSGRPIGREQVPISALEIAAVDDRLEQTRLYFGTRRGELHRVDSREGQIIEHSLLGIAHDGISALATTQLHGQAVIISGGQDGAVTIWDSSTEEPIRTATVNRYGNVPALCVVDEKADAPLLVTGGQDGSLSYRRLDQMAEQWREEFAAPVTVAVSLPFHSAGVIVGLASGDIYFNRDIRRADLKWVELGQHHGDISGLEGFIVGGRLVVASCALDRELRLWDLSTRLILQSIPLDGIPLGLCSSAPTVGVATTAGASVFAFNDDPLVLALRSQ